MRTEDLAKNMQRPSAESKSGLSVYKFGGASMKDAEGFRNVANILACSGEQPLLIVVSALGKTTNLLEKLAQSYYERDVPSTQRWFAELQDSHSELLHELFDDPTHKVFDEVSNRYTEIEWIIEDEPHAEFDFVYDQIVSMGELLSSIILSEFLSLSGTPNVWTDARDYILTDNTYREGNVDWNATQKNIETRLAPFLRNSYVLTQGFLGGTSENYSITLGREGSDYSAAIFAHCLNASSLTVWKDVPGMMNADPAIFPNAQILPELSYSEARELAYLGATVIHHKTLNPLQNKNIPLFIKSFIEPTKNGTLISNKKGSSLIPSYILKRNQVLMHIQTRHPSFMLEQDISTIFRIFFENHMRINLLEHSALRFSTVVDKVELGQKMEQLLEQLSEVYTIECTQEHLELLTIRHYSAEPAAVNKLIEGKNILLQSKTLENWQVLYS